MSATTASSWLCSHASTYRPAGWHRKSDNGTMGSTVDIGASPTIVVTDHPAGHLWRVLSGAQPYVTPSAALCCPERSLVSSERSLVSSRAKPHVIPSEARDLGRS